MRKQLMSILVLVAVLLALTVGTEPTLAATGDPVLLNEVLASHTGTDDTEYIEFFGTPGTSLDGLSVIVVEGDAFEPGTIDRRFDFKPYHELGSNGFFLIGNCGGLPAQYGVTPDASLFTNYLENSSLTVALVETASLSGGEGDSLTGSEVVLDAVALTDGDAGDTFYFGAPVIGPDGSYFPAGARRVTDGVDTDTAADWVISDFSLGPDNTPTGGGLDGCAPLALTIPEIQGNSQRSVYEGEMVTTSGVVTLISADGRDMWIQDSAGDADPSTSDGIFVDDRDSLDPRPEVGDLIRVTAAVEEEQYAPALPLTRLNDPNPDSLEIISSDNPLPKPVRLIDLPNVSITEGIDFWEPLEGMLVEVKNARVAAATSAYGEFAILARKDTRQGSGFFFQTSHLLIRSLGDENVDYNPERILVDDSSLDEPIVVKPGDRVQSLVGVVDYTFGNFKLQPASFDVRTRPFPTAPVSKRTGHKGNITITTYNVENLFDLEDNPDKDDESSTPTPEELETQLTKLALAVELELQTPEIIVMQEVENTAILQELGDRVNDATGTNYVATSFETSDVRGIEVGFLWDADRVDLLDAFQLTDDIVPGVSDAFGPDSPSPGREPLVGVFRIEGHRITVIGNHFKSKSGDDPLFGVNWPPIRVTEVQRKAQARVVRDFVNAILDEDPCALVMVAGDLNDFQFSEPGEGADHPVAILEGGSEEVQLINLVNLERWPERFTYVYDGNSQVLDHMFVSPALLPRSRGVDILHFNAGFPSDLGEDASTPLRSSDHDPLEARFNFPPVDRFATFNASLNRSNAGDLITDLSTPDNAQAQAVAEIIQRTRPDVLLINEFDFDEGGEAASLFQANYLSVSQNGADPITYDYRFVAPSNTGIPSGFDLDNDGSVGGPNDAFGFGYFPGQYGMAVFSRYPIEVDDVRTFQMFLWKDMPGALLPDDPDTPEPADWYSPEELEVFRLSSKSHWDVPIRIGWNTVHLLVSHPTPPTFDGPEDRNGRRNHDEIRFWADYITPSRSRYIYDDQGRTGGLKPGGLFVIAGDQNADPFDGDSVPGAIQQLLKHPRVNTKLTPSSEGGPEQAALQGGANETHVGDPSFDTADFSDTAPGNLRVDYVLPRKNLRIIDGAVFWPTVDDPLFSLVGTYPFPSSDHRLVWLDIQCRSH